MYTYYYSNIFYYIYKYYFNTYTQTKPATLDLTTSSSSDVLKLRANT